MDQSSRAVEGPLEPSVGRLEPKRYGARAWAVLRGLVCRHTHGRLVAVEWDGTAVYECIACGNHVEKPL